MAQNYLKKANLPALLLLICFACGSGPCIGQSDGKITEDSVMGPKMVFAETSIDWGEVFEGDSARVHFTFTNAGDQAVEITTVKGGCSCTVPDWIRTDVNPGEEGWVKAAFGSRDKIGDQERTLVIIHNGDPPIRLKLHGKVLPRPIESAPPPDPDKELIIKSDSTKVTPWGGFGGW